MLTAANYEESEVGGKLYIVGGYGFDRTLNKFITYDTLTSVDLNGLMAWVKGDPAAPALTSIFRTIHDPALQVTGGEMTMLNGKAMLVFGQNSRRRLLAQRQRQLHQPSAQLHDHRHRDLAVHRHGRIIAQPRRSQSVPPP